MVYTCATIDNFDLYLDVILWALHIDLVRIDLLSTIITIVAFYFADVYEID